MPGTIVGDRTASRSPPRVRELKLPVGLDSFLQIDLDVARLGPAWRLDRIRSFELFPQPAHVETVLRRIRA